jgi:hypothetical protein
MLWLPLNGAMRDGQYPKCESGHPSAPRRRRWLRLLPGSVGDRWLAALTRLIAKFDDRAGTYLLRSMLAE